MAVLRLQRRALDDLARLEERNRALLDVQRSLEPRPSLASDDRLGSDPIEDFHRLVMAELKVWAAEAAAEMDNLPGSEFEGRRAALRRLCPEIQELCAEIAERETMWSKAARLPRPDPAPLPSVEPRLR